MPELSDDKIAKLSALFKSKGVDPSSERARLDRLFVEGEKDPSTRSRNDILLTKHFGPSQRPREDVAPLGARDPALAEAMTTPGWKPKMPESPLKAGVGAFASGVLGAAKPYAGIAAPGVPKKYMDRIVGAQQGVVQDLTGAAQKDYPKLSAVAETAGHIAPMLAIPGSAFATPGKAFATGATMGVLGTEGGAKEKVIAAGAGGLSFGLSTKITQAMQPVMQRFGGKLLAMGMDRNAATKAVVRFAPHVQHAITDSAAFTALGAVEQEARHRLSGTEKMPLDDLFLTNLGTVLIAKGMAAAVPRPGERFARGRRTVELREAFAKEPGGVSANIGRREALGAGNDALIVHAAYMDAMRGKGWTPAEARALAAGGPAALRRKVAPARVADLFEPDAPKEAPPPTAAPGVRSSPVSERAYRAQASAAARVVETQKARADATLRADTFRRAADGMDREAQRHEAAAAREAVREVADAGRTPPEIQRAISALDPRTPIGDTATRVKKLEADAARLDELAGRIERQAGAEETRPAQLALDLPNVARPLREKFNDPNTAKKMRLRAGELRDEATALRESAGREEARTTYPPAPRPAEPPPRDFKTPAALAAEWKAKAAETRRKADVLQMDAETAADIAIDRAKRVRQWAAKQDPDADAVANILPSDSVGARALRETSVDEAGTLVRRLGDSRTAVSPDQEIGVPRDAASVRKMEVDLAATPPGEPGAEFARAHSGDVGRVMPWDYFRQLIRTAPKILGEALGRDFYERAVQASWKTRQMKHLVRTAAAARFRKWSAWLESLAPQQQAQAIDRFVNLTEQGRTTGAHPIETEFLTFWNRVMRGYANVIETHSGKPLALKGRYLSHVFETLDASTTGNARRAAEQILGEWRGSTAAKPGGSRFLHARQSTRQDFVRDVFFLFDAYVNSMTPAIHWKPVERWLANLRAPGGAFEQIMAENLRKSGGDIKKAKELRKRMDEAESFLRKHIAAGMGRQESWLGIADKLDAALSAGMRGLGMKPKAPYRNLMRAYTYAQYVGGLGLNVGSSLRNLSQNINTVTEVGPTWWGKAMTLLAEINAGTRPDINRLVRQAHINDSSLARDVRTQVQSMFGRELSGLGQGVADATMSLFTAAEYVNRTTAYLAAYLKAKSRGQTEKQARAYGREVVSRTQFDYTPGLGGVIYNGPFTHALFQFARFPTYQFDYLASVAGRAVSGKTDGMLPGDKAIAPALRMALATLATSPLLAALGLDMNDSMGIGGVPEPVKFGLTRGAEAIGEARGGFEGRLAARRSMRGLGLEPFETTAKGAVERMMGPLYRQGSDLWDMYLGGDLESHEGRKRFGNDIRVLFPGLAVHRFMRFLDEYDEKQVRNSRTGEVMFPVEEGDAWARLAGINPADVIGKYEKVRDQKIREKYDSDARTILYDDVRAMYRELRDAKDPEYVEKTMAKFAAGMRDIFAQTGIAPLHDLGQAFKENVVKRVELGDVTTKDQRSKVVIDRSELMGGR